MGLDLRLCDRVLFFFYQFVHFKFLLTFAYFGRAKPSMVKVKTEKFFPFFFFFF